MKKFILVGVILMIASVKIASAQDFNYQRAYQDFLYNLSIYNSRHDEYVLRRSEYLQYKTLVSDENARKTTSEMLKARDETVKTLLTAIRMRVIENQGLVDSEKESLYQRIDPEVKYFSDHKDLIPSAGSLSDLEKDSQKAKEHFEGSTQLVINISLVYLPTGKVAAERKEVERLLSQIKTKITQIKQNNDKDVSFTNKAFIDIDNQLSRSREKENEAKNPQKTWQEAMGLVQESYLYVKNAVSYQNEIIRLIKTN